MSTITGTITAIKRTSHSINGNPAFFITLDNGQRYRTQSDTSWAYAVDNSMIGKKFTFELTTAGRIRYAR